MASQSKRKKIIEINASVTSVIDKKVYTIHSTTTMGSESTSHTTEDFYFENTIILGKNWESGNELEVKTFFFFREHHDFGKTEIFLFVTTLVSYTKTASATFFWHTK